MSTFNEDMLEVERLLERELSEDELNMLVTMRDAGKTPAQIAEVLAKEPPKADPRTVRYEGIGSTGRVVDITNIPVPEDLPEAENAADAALTAEGEPAPAAKQPSKSQTRRISIMTITPDTD